MADELDDKWLFADSDGLTYEQRLIKKAKKNYKSLTLNEKHEYARLQSGLPVFADHPTPKKQSAREMNLNEALSGLMEKKATRKVVIPPMKKKYFDNIDEAWQKAHKK